MRRILFLMLMIFSFSQTYAAMGPTRDRVRPEVHQADYTVIRTSDGHYEITAKPGFRRIYVKVRGVLYSLYLNDSGRFDLVEPHPSATYRRSIERELGDRIIETDDISTLNLTFIDSQGDRYDLKMGNRSATPVRQTGDSGNNNGVDQDPQDITPNPIDHGNSDPICALMGSCNGSSGGGSSTGGGGLSSGGGTSSSSSGSSFPTEGLFAAPAWKEGKGPVIYVSPSGGGSGNSISSPTTVKAALARMAPGTIVQFAPGIYSGFAIPKSGTAAAPIFFKAQNPAVTSTNTKTGEVSVVPDSQASFLGGINTNSQHYIVVDGFRTKNGGGGMININTGSSHILTRRFHINEPCLGTANNIKGAQYVGFIGGYLTSMGSSDSCPPSSKRKGGNRLGYGIVNFGSEEVEIRGNVFKGATNHFDSTKEDILGGVYYISNYFEGCGNLCLHVGQNTDYSDYGDGDATSKNAIIKDNVFVHKRYPANDLSTGINLQNFESITLENNKFTGFSTPIRVDYLSGNERYIKKATPWRLQHKGVTPKDILIKQNDINGGTILLNSRGTPDDIYTLRNNTGSAACRISTIWSPAKYFPDPFPGINYTIKPRVIQSQNSFTCR